MPLCERRKIPRLNIINKKYKKHERVSKSKAEFIN